MEINRFATIRGTATRIWNKGDSYTFFDEDFNPSVLADILDLSKEKKQFSSKEELWEKAKEAMRKEYGFSNYLMNNRWETEKKVLEFFTAELENVAYRWTGSYEHAQKIIAKIIQKFEYDIFRYLDIQYERTYLFSRYGLFMPNFSIGFPFDVLSDSSDWLAEGQLYESLFSFLFQPSKQPVLAEEDFVPYVKEGTIDLNDLVTCIFSQIRIYIFRLFIRKRISQITIQHQVPSIFLPTISFMQTKASLA